MRVTTHAIDRYLERRGWSRDDPGARGEAEARLLDLWGRRKCSTPPLRRSPNGEWGRKWKVGDMILVTDGDVSTLITFYPTNKKRRPYRPR